jgi:acetate kinase
VKILVLNSGSSSLKYQLIDMTNKEAIVEGICERVGSEGSCITYKVPEKKIKEKLNVDFPTHKEAIAKVLELVQDKEMGVIESLDEIEAIGHRVVHGGELFDKSVVVTNEVIEKLKTISNLAPLHNPANLLGIEICQSLMPTKKNVAVFDTAFHQTMPREAYMYALPYADYEELRVRKYGFHGTSHKYVSNIATNLVGKEDAKVIVCHLGNGSSISAVQGRKCMDTSMGLTPLQGLMMGTRCGDIDPAAVIYIAKERGLSLDDMDKRMNKESGILGVFGGTSDFRDVRDAYEKGEDRAKLTVDMLTYRIKSYLTSYAGALGGADAICFTGGIGENAELVREKVCENLEFMGIKLSKEKNDKFRSLADEDGIVEISKEDSATKIYIIPTNEELVIAEDTHELVR